MASSLSTQEGFPDRMISNSFTPHPTIVLFPSIIIICVTVETWVAWPYISSIRQKGLYIYTYTYVFTYTHTHEHCQGFSWWDERVGFNMVPPQQFHPTHFSALKEWPNACNVNLYVGTDGLSWHADVASSQNGQGAKMRWLGLTHKTGIQSPLDEDYGSSYYFTSVDLRI